MAEAECYPRRDQADAVPAAGDNRPSWILQASTHSASLSTSSSLYLCLCLYICVEFCFVFLRRRPAY